MDGPVDFLRLHLSPNVYIFSHNTLFFVCLFFCITHPTQNRRNLDVIPPTWNVLTWVNRIQNIHDIGTSLDE